MPHCVGTGKDEVRGYKRGMFQRILHIVMGHTELFSPYPCAHIHAAIKFCPFYIPDTSLSTLFPAIPIAITAFLLDHAQSLLMDHLAGLPPTQPPQG